MVPDILIGSPDGQSLAHKQRRGDRTGRSGIVDSPAGRSVTHQQRRGDGTGQDGNDPFMWIVTASNM